MSAEWLKLQEMASQIANRAKEGGFPAHAQEAEIFAQRAGQEANKIIEAHGPEYYLAPAPIKEQVSNPEEVQNAVCDALLAYSQEYVQGADVLSDRLVELMQEHTTGLVSDVTPLNHLVVPTKEVLKRYDFKQVPKPTAPVQEKVANILPQVKSDYNSAIVPLLRGLHSYSLERHNIETIGDFRNRSYAELMTVRHFGEQRLSFLEKLFTEPQQSA